MNNLDPILKNIGLSEKEWLIYTTLYASTSMSVADLSKKLGIPRTTIYQHIEQMMKKGLVAQTIKGNKKHIIAELPTRLESIVKENKTRAESLVKEIEEIERSLPQLINHLKGITPDLKNLPQIEVKYYEGHKSVSRVYDDLLTHSEIRSYVNAEQIGETFPENIEKFNGALSQGIVIYDIVTKDSNSISFQNQFAEKYKDEETNQQSSRPRKNYFFKYLPEETNIDYMDYLIYGESIAIIQGGAKPSALVIHNKLLAANARTIYDVLWNLLPEFNTK